MKTVQLQKSFNVPVEKLWDALTKVSEMKEWYFDIKEFKCEKDFQFEFYGGTFLHRCIVTDVVPCKKIEYSWEYPDFSSGRSLLTFELNAESFNTSNLKLTHEGLANFPDTPDFAFENFVAGWNEIIGKLLKKYLEK